MTWSPLGARPHYGRPPAGVLLAHAHAVWRVTAVVLPDLTDADREIWVDVGMPDLNQWRGRPFRLDCAYVGGTRPDWAPRGTPTFTASMPVAASRYGGQTWYLYDGDRWPQCSCCGEPVPCRAELQDREVAASLDRVEELVAKVPGACWACGEPITHRQASVTYAGDNVELPGGPEPVFHARQSCAGSAQRYELAWLAVDPRRERILTYPTCGGILVVHGDGSSECRSGRGPVGTEHVSDPECWGHLTHDHATHASCYVGGDWFARTPCPRGCDPETHPGTQCVRRPTRRTPREGTLL